MDGDAAETVRPGTTLRRAPRGTIASVPVERMLVAVDDERARPREADDRDVALRVDVRRLSLALAPDEERRVQILALDAPGRPSPGNRGQVDELHALTVAVRSPAYPRP